MSVHGENVSVANRRLSVLKHSYNVVGTGPFGSICTHLLRSFRAIFYVSLSGNIIVRHILYVRGRNVI